MGNERGMTLVEVLAASVLSLIVITLIYYVFFNNMALVTKSQGDMALREDADTVVALLLKEINQTDFDYIQTNGSKFILKKAIYSLNNDKDWIKESSLQDVETIEVVNNTIVISKDGKPIYSSSVSPQTQVINTELKLNADSIPSQVNSNSTLYESGVFTLTLTIANKLDQTIKPITLISQIGF